jgi:hypothetical protein
LERHFEAAESEFNSVHSIWFIEVVFYSELHRIFGVIVRRNIIFLRVPKAYSAALVCSGLITALPRVFVLLLEKKSSELERGT